MIRDITIGQYYPVDSPIHRLDPRVKLAATFLFIIGIFCVCLLYTSFRNYYEKAVKMQGMTGLNLMIMLEMRLDNVMFRLGFARTRMEARQIVDHKFVLVNGKQVNIPSVSYTHLDVYKRQALGSGIIPHWDGGFSSVSGMGRHAELRAGIFSDEMCIRDSPNGGIWICGSGEESKGESGDSVSNWQLFEGFHSGCRSTIGGSGKIGMGSAGT